MKVKNLKTGMMVQPAGDSEVFWVNPPWGNNKFPWVQVRTIHRGKIPNGNQTWGKMSKRPAIYLGTRKEVNISTEDQKYSNRYVLIDGEICAVDSSAWKRIKKI